MEDVMSKIKSILLFGLFCSALALMPLSIFGTDLTVTPPTVDQPEEPLGPADRG